jgi:hypothetical protein
VTPWDDYIGVGMGVLRIQPSEFWAMGWREFVAAKDGFIASRTGGKPVGPPTWGEAQDITERAEAMLKRQGKM